MTQFIVLPENTRTPRVNVRNFTNLKVANLKVLQPLILLKYKNLFKNLFDKSRDKDKMLCMSLSKISRNKRRHSTAMFGKFIENKKWVVVSVLRNICNTWYAVFHK